MVFWNGNLKRQNKPLPFGYGSLDSFRHQHRLNWSDAEKTLDTNDCSVQVYSFDDIKIMNLISSFSLIVTSLLLCYLPNSADAQEILADYALTHINIVDVKAGKIIENQTLILREGKITTIGSAESVTIPDDVSKIDGRGKFAIPGLWDMHIHWYDQKSMQLFPLNGVTGVRVMWGMPQHHTWRKSFSFGKSLGPRMIIGSTIVDGPEPFWRGSIVAKDAESAKSAVEKTQKAKAEFVKVYSLLSREAYFEIAKICNENKIDFGGHVPMMVSAWEASDAGQRSMEHMYEILLSCSSKEKELRDRLMEKRKAGRIDSQSV